MIRRFLERRRFMREHEWTHAHLSEYVDEDLSPAERRRVEEHVGMCPQCRRVLDTLRRTVRSLMGLPAEAPPDLADRVINRLRTEG
jgi:anti-sigma factor RsiW